MRPGPVPAASWSGSRIRTAVCGTRRGSTRGARWWRERCAPGASGPYQLQAAIAAIHDEARTADETDWPQILGLYEVLARIAPSPVVDLNRAVALAMVAGPAAGLAAIDAVAADPVMGEYRFFHAARADLLRRMDRWPEALAAYERALALEPNAPERAFLEGRREEARRRSIAG